MQWARRDNTDSYTITDLILIPNITPLATIGLYFDL